MLLYQIAVTLLPGIGDLTARKLIAYCGGVEAVFKEKKNNLLKVPGIGEVLADSVLRQNVLLRAEKEISFIERYRIKPLFYLEDEYPSRLKQCQDGPIMLYYKGNAALNRSKIISIVGSRSATAYGRAVCDKLVENLVELDVLIVSGLAYGIDTCAHRAALDNNLQTLGVLAHGLDRIYPASNMKLAEKMLKSGGLLTDFPSGKKPDRMNFPRRNRIIAGIADAVVVVESADRGGALITADIANSYSREVFAIPGRWDDPYSFGCNYLIRSNKAALIQSPEDLKLMMGWEKEKFPRKINQHELFNMLNQDEEIIARILQENGETGIDILCLASGLSMGLTSNALLGLELKGVIRSLPGKVYKMMN